MSYYAVIFTSFKLDHTPEYSEMADKMVTLARKQPGFIALESARDEIGITVSYWESLEAIKKWKANSEHLLAQQLGRSQWYDWYKVRVCKVEREYEFSTSNSK